MTFLLSFLLYSKMILTIRERNGFVPANVKETDKSYLLEIVAPGFEKADFKIILDQDLLTISAEKKNEETEKNESRSAKNIATGLLRDLSH